MTITFFGIGRVGRALAEHLSRAGHRIILARSGRKSESLEAALAVHPDWQDLPAQEALNRSQTAVLAIPFGAAESFLQPLDFRGQILIDCTNPVGPSLTHGLEGKISGSERIQQLVPGAKVVKAFNVYGAENLVQPPVCSGGPAPVMPLAGDDPKARDVVSGLVIQTGFVPLDTGSLDRALQLEHLALLWIKMVRGGGRNPHWAWALAEVC